MTIRVGLRSVSRSAPHDHRLFPIDDVHAERAVARVPALVTIVFGLVVLFCVGFLQVSAVHNGAHDTRHANGFPCH